MIDVANEDKKATAQQKWKEAQDKADYDHKAELLRLKQKYEQDARDASEKARTGTAQDRAQYQAKQLAAKQAYEQSVRNQTQKYQTERDAALKANAEAQRDYNRKIGETAQQNREATAAERAKADRDARLQVGGSQLIYGLRQLDKALRARANGLYGAVREKMAGSSLPSDTLADGVQRLPRPKGYAGRPRRWLNSMRCSRQAPPVLSLLLPTRLRRTWATRILRRLSPIQRSAQRSHELCPLTCGRRRSVKAPSRSPGMTFKVSTKRQGPG